MSSLVLQREFHEEMTLCISSAGFGLLYFKTSQSAGGDASWSWMCELKPAGGDEEEDQPVKPSEGGGRVTATLRAPVQRSARVKLPTVSSTVHR